MSTPEYVDLLMTWIEGQINNETIFPPDVSTCAQGAVGGTGESGGGG